MKEIGILFLTIRSLDVFQGPSMFHGSWCLCKAAHIVLEILHISKASSQVRYSNLIYKTFIKQNREHKVKDHIHVVKPFI